MHLKKPPKRLKNQKEVNKMAGRGMGSATKGGGCVGSGSRNKMTSKPSTKVAVMMKDGGMATPKKKMGGGMMKKYKKGGYAGCK